jgi:hypothetical protein
LNAGSHRIEAFLQVPKVEATDSGTFACQFIASSESDIEGDTWVTRNAILPDVAGSSWFMLLQLIVLFQCLQAILG